MQLIFKKRFKRLKRMQIEDSDGEEDDDGGMDREKIANQLFDGDEVSFVLILIAILSTILFRQFH